MLPCKMKKVHIKFPPGLKILEGYDAYADVRERVYRAPCDHDYQTLLPLNYRERILFLRLGSLIFPGRYTYIYREQPHTLRTIQINPYIQKRRGVIRVGMKPLTLRKRARNTRKSSFG